LKLFTSEQIRFEGFLLGFILKFRAAERFGDGSPQGCELLLRRAG